MPDPFPAPTELSPDPLPHFIEEGGSHFAPDRPPIRQKPAPDGPYVVSGFDFSQLPKNALLALAADDTITVSAVWTDEENKRATEIARTIVKERGWDKPEQPVMLAEIPDAGPTLPAERQVVVDWLKQDINKTLGDLFDSRFGAQHAAILNAVLDDVATLAQMTVGGVDKKTLVRVQGHIVAQLANITAFNSAQVTQAIWAALGRYIRWGFSFALSAAGIIK